MKTWICRQGIILFAIYPLVICFPVLISYHLASIFQQYSLAYSEPCQTSKMERFAKIVMRRNSVSVENLYLFDDFRGRGECKGNELAQNHFILEVTSNCLVYTFSSKSDEILISTPVCLFLEFRYKIFKYQLQIRIQHLQVG